MYRKVRDIHVTEVIHSRMLNIHEHPGSWTKFFVDLDCNKKPPVITEVEVIRLIQQLQAFLAKEIQENDSTIPWIEGQLAYEGAPESAFRWYWDNSIVVPDVVLENHHGDVRKATIAWAVEMVDMYTCLLLRRLHRLTGEYGYHLIFPFLPIEKQKLLPLLKKFFRSTLELQSLKDRALPDMNCKESLRCMFSEAGDEGDKSYYMPTYILDSKTKSVVHANVSPLVSPKSVRDGLEKLWSACTLLYGRDGTVETPEDVRRKTLLARRAPDEDAESDDPLDVKKRFHDGLESFDPQELQTKLDERKDALLRAGVTTILELKKELALVAVNVINRFAAYVNYSDKCTPILTKFWDGKDDYPSFIMKSHKDAGYVFQAGGTVEWVFPGKTRLHKFVAWDAWKEHPKHLHFNRLVFTDLGAEEASDFNSFRGMLITEENSKGYDDAFGWMGTRTKTLFNADRLLTHVYNYLCGRSAVAFQFFMKWNATVIQRPFTRITTSPILITPQGTGKDLFLSEINQLIMGERYFLQTSDYTDFVGHFTDALEDKILVVFDEAHKHVPSVHSRLMSLLGDTNRRVERKGFGATTTRNVIKLGMTSNIMDPKAFPLSNSNRRFCPIRSLDRAIVQDLPYWEDLREFIYKHGGAKVMAHIYYSINLDCEPGLHRVPRCDLVTEYKLASASHVERYWLHVLGTAKVGNDTSGDDPGNPHRKNLFVDTSFWPEGNGTFPIQLFHEIFIKWCELSHRRQPFPDEEELKMGSLHIFTPRLKVDTWAGVSIFKSENLDSMRRKFEQYFDSEINWKEMDGALGVNPDRTLDQDLVSIPDHPPVIPRKSGVFEGQAPGAQDPGAQAPEPQAQFSPDPPGLVVQAPGYAGDWRPPLRPIDVDQMSDGGISDDVLRPVLGEPRSYQNPFPDMDRPGFTGMMDSPDEHPHH